MNFSEKTPLAKDPFCLNAKLFAVPFLTFFAPEWSMTSWPVCRPPLLPPKSPILSLRECQWEFALNQQENRGFANFLRVSKRCGFWRMHRSYQNPERGYNVYVNLICTKNRNDWSHSPKLEPFYDGPGSLLFPLEKSGTFKSFRFTFRCPFSYNVSLVEIPNFSVQFCSSDVPPWASESACNQPRDFLGRKIPISQRTPP